MTKFEIEKGPIPKKQGGGRRKSSRQEAVVDRAVAFCKKGRSVNYVVGRFFHEFAGRKLDDYTDTKKNLAKRIRAKL